MLSSKYGLFEKEASYHVVGEGKLQQRLDAADETQRHSITSG
jgi:hypothetical protein